MSCAWGGEKEDYGDPCGKRPGFRSPSMEGPLGLSLSPSGGTGLEYRLGRERDEKGRERDGQGMEGSLTQSASLMVRDPPCVSWGSVLRSQWPAL